MNKGHLFFLIGLPRSGKSTYANNWVRTKLVVNEPPRVIVSGDDIRLALTGERYNSHVNPFIFPIEHVCIKAHLNRGCNVLADDTHTTWGSIRDLLKIDPDAIPIWYPFIIDNGRWDYRFNPNDLSYNGHIWDCQHRADLTKQSDLKPVIANMASNLKRLHVDFWQKLEEERVSARNYIHRIQVE